METVVVCGISHKTSPIEERERVSFGNMTAGEVLRALIVKRAVNECVMVSTCNRIEIYAACKNSEECFGGISEFLCELNEQVQRDFIRNKFYFFEGVEAIRHLHRVAAGMDSMVVGEPQILGQLKRAYETALQNRTAGITLNKLFQSAFSTTKKIKNKTGGCSHTVSVSSVAAQLARNIFGDIEKCSVMVVGTGEASEEAAIQLAKRGAGKIRIAGKNRKKASQLAFSVGGETLTLEEIGLWMRKTDIVISATGSPDYILKREDLLDAMKLRKNEPISLIDIAFPRDIDPKVGDIEGVFLYDMDDLQNIVEKNRVSLRKSLYEAENIIREDSERFVFWQKGLKAFPLIVELRKKTGEIVNEETLKAIAKIDALEKQGNCDKEERDRVLKSLTRSIMGKFLHSPVTKLKGEAAQSPEQSSYVDVVRELFELSGENSTEISRNENKNRKQG